MTPDPRSELDPEEIAAAAFLLRLSARPVVIAGSGAADATGELVRLAEAVGAPVLTTGDGIFPDDHPLSAGQAFVTASANRLAAGSDMVLAVGTSFAQAEQRGKPELPAQMIHIDVDASQIDRVYPVRNGIVGDAKVAIRRILEELERAAPIAALAEARASQAPNRAAEARGAPGPGS